LHFLNKSLYEAFKVQLICFNYLQEVLEKVYF
jgi:hypothetical protein